MKYVLRKPVLGEVPDIEISEEQYKIYKESRVILINCLDIEEKYEILVSNYLELEKNILCANATYMVRDHIGYSDFFDLRLALNICLVNLLTSARLYVDQLHHHVKECVPHLDGVIQLIKNLLAKEYDENPEFRFMEALRNYVQHRGIPVHWTSSGERWTEIGEDGLLEYYLELAALKSVLEEDGEFKKQVLNECSDKVDLKSATRSYIESISKVHDAVRELVRKSVQDSRLNLEEAHTQYSKVYKESLVGLSACIINDCGIIETVPLLLDWDDVRVKLQKRNRKLINLKKRYVTSKVQKS
ncbi:MAG: hypothetical protein Q7U03_14440 [Syntrophales bacterium]|nr:hypothetical protein [Syntrophales bacterium]